ncbi:MAG: hypothetical protein MZW92_07770 [Comamonadaceae bacterium]|nr:hypothetical protein [Comamonadaceae bacterium]
MTTDVRQGHLRQPAAARWCGWNCCSYRDADRPAAATCVLFDQSAERAVRGADRPDHRARPAWRCPTT